MHVVAQVCDCWAEKYGYDSTTWFLTACPLLADDWELYTQKEPGELSREIREKLISQEVSFVMQWWLALYGLHSLFVPQILQLP